MADYLVQEDGTSKILLEDGSGALLLESSVPGFTAPFIGSATVLHTPTLAYTGDISLSAPGTYDWICPAGVDRLYVEAYGGGGGGGSTTGFVGGGGGGGGAFAVRTALTVTPGTTYTFTVGAAGAAGSDGGSSSFTGDSGVQVVAVGGKHGSVVGSTAPGGAGGQAADCAGDSAFSGGNGADGAGFTGGGGGASGDRLAAGASGSGISGGAGANGGGSGGAGSDSSGGPAAQPGSSPGGGGGGPGGGSNPTPAAGADGRIAITCGFVLPFIASNTVVNSPTLPIETPFIGSTTVVYTPTLPIQIFAPFIGSTTVVYTPDLPEVHVPFIQSGRVYGIFSLFDPNKTYSGPGNGGETFLIRLNANGVTGTATLAANITADATALDLTGDGSLPSTEPFMVTIDTEILYVVQLAPGSYRIRGRGMSNTTPAAHTAGATVSWDDTYDMPIRVTDPIAGSFTANINSTGSYTYPGWLVAFDSTQAYLSGSRYMTSVSELLGVFAAGSGSSGSNKCDAAQPSAIASPSAVSDHAPAGLTNPSRIQTDIDVGDIALVRYTNPEATVLDLGPRSTAIQSWFGLKRVDATDNDVTFTDPNGIVVDTTGGELTYTGSVNAEYAEPLPLATGIAPDASDAAGVAIDTPNPVPWETVTLPGTDRFFTYGSPHYSEKGWPFGVITVRQGNRRIPHWQSWDWHNFSYVYTGFGVDDTFAQIVINRNGIIFGSDTVVLPGPQDIDGPNAVWDDASYYYAVCWYVVIFAGPYVVVGPVIGGTEPSPGSTGTPMPTVGFPGGTGGAPGPPIIGVPPVEGGSGGGIDGTPVSAQLFQAASV